MATPTSVYDLTEVARNFAALATVLPGVGIRYAVKANPQAAVLETLPGLGALTDASLIGAVRRVLAAGAVAADVSFTGPANRRDEVEEAVAQGLGWKRPCGLAFLFRFQRWMPPRCAGAEHRDARRGGQAVWRSCTPGRGAIGSKFGA